MADDVALVFGGTRHYWIYWRLPVATMINLRDGSQALVQATIDQLSKALEGAIARGQLLQIEGPDGKVVVINPNEVVSGLTP